jgi:hypothetical protein
VEKIVRIEENINFFTIYIAKGRDTLGIIQLVLAIAVQQQEYLSNLLNYLAPQITRITTPQRNMRE